MAKTLLGMTMNEIPSMDDTPAPAPAAGGGAIPSMEDSPKPEGAGAKLLKSNAKNLLSVADMVGSVPAALVGTLSDAAFRVRAIAKGEDRREVGREGNIAYQTAMEQYGNPFSKLLHFAGLGAAEGENPSGVDGLMTKAASLLDKGGEWAEKHSGGVVQKEDITSLTNEALAIAGGRGIKAGLLKMAKTLPDVTAKGLLRGPETERANAYKETQAAQEKMPTAPSEAAEQGSKAAEAAVVAKTKLVDPKELVLDPVTGTLSEKVPEMGKELPKPTTLESGLDKVANGRRFDMTAEERIAVKGLQDRPLDNPIVDEQGKILRRGGRFDREGGAIDSKLMAKLAAVGLGAWAGAYFDDDNQLGGAVLGGMLGAGVSSVPMKSVVGGLKKAFGPDKRLKINDFADAHEKYTRLLAHDSYAAIDKMHELVPDEADRIAITHARESGDLSKLTPKQLAAEKVYADFVDKLGSEASLEGVLGSARENYVTHVWDWGANKNIFQKWMESKGSSPGMGTTSKFAQERKFDTLAEGKAAGLKPLSEDPSVLLGIYANSMGRAIANKIFTRGLMNEKVPGTNLGLVVKAEDAPHYYEMINNPALAGVKVHPDIAPSLKMLYETNSPGAAMKIMMGISDTSKRMAVSMSLFHAKALTDAMVAAGGNPIKNVAGIPRLVLGGRKILGREIMKEPAFITELKKGSASPLVQDAAEGGLKYSLPHEGAGVEDAGNTFYTAMTAVQDALDKTIPGAGLPVKGLVKINHAVDATMWERLHAGMKLNIFGLSRDKLLANAAKKGVALSREQANRIAASYTNDLFGGLNWRRIAEDSKSYLGRTVGQAMLNPGARRMMGILMFAPDWTVSTTRAALKAFGGRPDFISPTTMAGLHQQYLLRAAVYYMIVGDAINYSMSGHHLWENKDPTVLDMDPKGETHMQWSKHTMEPVHWLTKPGQQAINKLGMIPREVTQQALGVEYLSAKGRMPPMKNRIAHLAKNLEPISAQQADQGGAGNALAGFAGVPIYGKTAKQKEKDREERAKKRKQK